MSRTILILSATPRDTTPLRVDEEVREIEDAIRRSQYRNEFPVIPRLAVRARDVQRALLEHRPAIVHFSGHGRGEQGVVLEDDQGHPLLVGSDALANLFAVIAKRHAIECVLLNACHSQTQIGQLARHVPYVIGMRQALDDRAGVAFARAFYEGLGNGASIPDAHEMACSTVWMSGLCGEHIAVLESRAGAEPPGWRAATSRQMFALDPPASAGRRDIQRAARWIAMSATLLVPTLLVCVFGLQVHRARELLIGTSGVPFSYGPVKLLETGLIACVGLISSMASGLLVGLGIERWAVPVLIAICVVTLLLARSGKPHRCILWICMLLPLLACGSLFLAQAASVHHVAIPAADGWTCQPGPSIPQQIQFEVCSWLINPSRINEGRRVALDGLSGWFALTLAVVTWTAVRSVRSSRGSRVWSRTAIGMALAHGLLCLFVLAQIPRTRAMTRWGVRYPRVVQVDPACKPEGTAAAIGVVACHAVDVSAGAKDEIVVLWGNGCPGPESAAGGAYHVRLTKPSHATGQPCIQQTHGLQSILGGVE